VAGREYREEEDEEREGASTGGRYHKEGRERAREP